ncbi:hypothetical protein BH23VER1_BH23VER1_32880 [soil metagenome]
MRPRQILWLRIAAVPVGMGIGLGIRAAMVAETPPDAPRDMAAGAHARADPAGPVVTPAADATSVFPSLDPDNDYRSRARILAFAESLDDAGLAAAAKAALELPGDAADRRALVGVLVARWAAADAEGCARFCLALEEPPPAVGDAFAELAKIDRSLAVDLVGQVQGAQMVLHCWNRLLEGLVEVAPDEAVALAKGAAQEAYEASGSRYGSALQSLIRRYAELDPAGAAAALADESPEVIEQNMARVAREWAKADAAAAWDWIMARPEGRGRDSAVGLIVEAAAENDPATAARMLDGISSERPRAQALEITAAAWARRDPSALQKWADTLMPVERGLAVGQLVAVLAQEDVEEAKALALSLPEGKGREAAQVAGIEALKRADPFAAAAWYSEASGGRGLESPGRFAAGSVTDEVVRADPERALLWALEQGGNDALNLPRRIIETWMKRDPGAVGPAIAAIPDAKKRERALADYGVGLARRGGADAIRWADSLDGQERFGALAGIAAMGGGRETLAAFDRLQELAATDADRQRILGAAITRASGLSGNEQRVREMAGWIRDLQWPELQARFARSLTDSWASNDPRAASEWTAALPPGMGRDAAADGLAQRITRNDPASAWQWAVAIGDADLRRDRTSAVANTWVKTDREAALEAVASADLPEDAKAALLEELVP